MPKKRIFETEIEEYLALKNKTKNQKTIEDGIIMPEFVANMMQDGTTKQAEYNRIHKFIEDNEDYEIIDKKGDVGGRLYKYIQKKPR